VVHFEGERHGYGIVAVAVTTSTTALRGFVQQGAAPDAHRARIAEQSW
jgi:hypothetical protein